MRFWNTAAIVLPLVLGCTTTEAVKTGVQIANQLIDAKRKQDAMEAQRRQMEAMRQEQERRRRERQARIDAEAKAARDRAHEAELAAQRQRAAQMEIESARTNIIRAIEGDMVRVVEELLPKTDTDTPFRELMLRTAIDTQPCAKAFLDAFATELRVTRRHLIHAGRAKCADGARSIAAALESTEVAYAAEIYTREVISQIHLDTDKTTNDALAEGLKIVLDECDIRCNADGPDSIPCAAQASAKEALKAHLADLAKQQNWIDSGGGIAANVCRLQREIKQAEATIKEEREIGKVAGVVNQDRLHEAGARIVRARAEIKEAKAHFKKTTGKNLDMRQWDCQ